ncbi:unnamed protein product [Eruca vesicaria subsp. sativa]|uniref:Uncharacterized protein n=1 Tax=Eruca vesicaria subsp. sativa TaxID=29727 RepID=A0ABC8LNK9_ERUVS|nr:unnamed protein product [Eruca vesicaria subsp. sativa]
MPPLPVHQVRHTVVRYSTFSDLKNNINKFTNRFESHRWILMLAMSVNFSLVDKRRRGTESRKMREEKRSRQRTREDERRRQRKSEDVVGRRETIKNKNKNRKS